jgi:hypothetical protein
MIWLLGWRLEPLGVIYFDASALLLPSIPTDKILSLFSVPSVFSVVKNEFPPKLANGGQVRLFCPAEIVGMHDGFGLCRF